MFQYEIGKKNIEFICDFKRNDLGNINDFCFLKDDKFCVCSQIERIHVFEIYLKSNHKFVKTDEIIVSLNYQKDNKQLLGGSLNNNVYMWDVAKEEILFTIIEKNECYLNLYKVIYI